MKKLAFLLPIFALAACGEEPAPAPVEAPVAAPVEPSLPTPDQEFFGKLFAANCPAAEPVRTSVCKRGMGSPEALCEFGLGEDDALRHKATLSAGEGEWILSDAETVCAEHDSHHVDPS